MEKDRETGLTGRLGASLIQDHVLKRSETIQRIRDCQGLCRELMDAWTLAPLSSGGSNTPRWSAIHASRRPRVPSPAASRRQATGWLPTSQQTRDKTGCGNGQAPRRLWHIPAAVLSRSLPFVDFVPWEALVRVTCLPSTTEVRPALFASRPTHRGRAWPCLHALHVGMPGSSTLGAVAGVTKARLRRGWCRVTLGHFWAGKEVSRATRFRDSVSLIGAGDVLCESILSALSTGAALRPQTAAASVPVPGRRRSEAMRVA